jgi:RNA polymerase-binding transcription factor
MNDMSVELPPDYQPSLTEDYMNPAQVEFFHRRLLQSRAELRHELEAIPPIGPDETAHQGDQTDHASADTDREFDFINRARVQSLLHQIEQALVRLENGSYGFCEVTGEPIGLKRLMAQPATPLSLAAQEQRERRAG